MTIDNHTNLDDRLALVFMDYQYQSINWHPLSLIIISYRFHRLVTPWWKVLMGIEDNTNSLIRDFKALQRNYNELLASLEFLQAKIDDLSTSNSVLQTNMEAKEKTNFVLRETVSNIWKQNFKKA